MSFKKYLLVPVILMVVCATANAAERWNVFVGNWKDLNQKDKTTGQMTRRAVYSVLGREPQFNVAQASDSAAGYEDFKAARETAVLEKADVVIFGSYYIENQSLAITVYVYDALRNQLKMRRVYQGDVTADIFETIDEISADVAVMVKEALPPFTDETEKEIRRLRAVVSETEASKVSRLFELGFGPRTIFCNAPATGLQVGGMVRIWDLRLDGWMMPLVGLPNYVWKDNATTFADPDCMGFSLAWYLPLFDKKLAVGVGAETTSLITNTTTNTYNNVTTLTVQGFQLNNQPWAGLRLNAFYDFSKYLKFSLSASPFFYDFQIDVQSADYLNPDTYTNTYEYQYYLPKLEAGVTWYLNDFAGFQASAWFLSMHNRLTVTRNGVLYRQEDNSHSFFSFYLGFVFRQDLMK